MVTDRMITVTLPNIEYEQTTPKLTQITKNCAAATAGSALAYTPIFRDAKADIERASITDVGSIVQVTRNSYVKVRNQKLNENILNSVGLNLQQYYQANQALQPTIAGALLQNMGRFNYMLWLLIGGVDDAGGHIHIITNPGRTECYDIIGFHAIGSGEHHAISTFISNNYQSSIDLRHGLFLAYEAKKRSEQATGVGEQTDVWLIQKEQISRFSQETVDKLDKIYTSKRQKESNIMATLEKQLLELDTDSIIRFEEGH